MLHQVADFIGDNWQKQWQTSGKTSHFQQNGR